MKTYIINKLVTILLLSLTLITQAQVKIPITSPKGSVSTTVGLTEVSINYFRPQVKGRKIFGKGNEYLIPFGKKWRTGANAGTKITLSEDVMIENKTLTAGTYQILTTPNKDKWEVFFYNDLKIGGNMAKFDEEKVALTFFAPVTNLTETVDVFTINISDLTPDSKSASIELVWENTSVKIPFTTSYHELVMESIVKNTKVKSSNYVKSAKYYYENNINMDRALKWIDLYLEEEKNQKQFWNLHLRAQILAAKGDKKEAIKAAKKSMEVSKSNPGGDFGYIKKNEDLINSLK